MKESPYPFPLSEEEQKMLLPLKDIKCPRCGGNKISVERHSFPVLRSISFPSNARGLCSECEQVFTLWNAIVPESFETRSEFRLRFNGFAKP